MNTIRYNYYVSPVGEMILAEFDGELVMTDWRWRRMRKSIDRRIMEGLGTEMEQADTELLKACRSQFDEYFKGNRREFELPLRPVGTPFQQSVWNELMQVPYGECATYLDLAWRMDKADAIRAVASANGANAHSIIIPCHRIIGSDGGLVGYAGGLRAKKALLRLEGAAVAGAQAELFDQNHLQS